MQGAVDATRRVPTIVYLHGFRSSPQSAKAKCLMRGVTALPEVRRPRLYVPALAPDPTEAIATVADWIDREVGASAQRDLTLVGSSLGGFYATHLAERFGARAALINPAIRPHEDLQRYAGTQRNMHTGEVFELSHSHFERLRSLAIARITRPERYLLLVRRGDEVLDWRAAVAHYAGANQYVLGGGDHGWTDFDDEIDMLLRFAGCAAATS
jgi:uncharacterized protein